MAMATFKKLSPLNLLTLALWGEARGEAVEGRLAVGCVIRNRKEKRNLSYHDVLLAPHQFSCFAPAGGEKNYKAVSALAEKLAKNDESVFADPLLMETMHIASGFILHRWLDNTDGADHYMTTTLYEGNHAPSWASKMLVTAVIGRHTFLRGQQ